MTNADVPETKVGDMISRQAAIDALCTQHGILYPISTIEELPSAERKKGEWIPVDSYTAYGGDEATWMSHGNPIAFYYCSECKEQAYAGEDGESLLTDFCPNCGARMESEESKCSEE